MNTKRHIASVSAAAVLIFTAGQAMTQSASDGVTGHTPPPGARPAPPPSGPGLSRLPLVDPKVVPPGESDPSQKPPAGEPGASAPPSPGQSTTGRSGR